MGEPPRERRRPGVPLDFLDVDSDELTPIRAIVRLGEQLEDHKQDDARAIAGVHESIKALDTRLASQIVGLDGRLSQKIADVGSVQTKLLVETAGQTVMLKQSMSAWDDDRRARSESAVKAAVEAKAAAESERKALEVKTEAERRAAEVKAEADRKAAERIAELKMDRRTKLILAVVTIVMMAITGLVVHWIEGGRGAEHPAATHEPAEAPEP